MNKHRVKTNWFNTPIVKYFVKPLITADDARGFRAGISTCGLRQPDELKVLVIGARVNSAETERTRHHALARFERKPIGILLTTTRG